MHELADELVDDSIVGLSPFLTRGDEPHSSQERELVAHDRHREPEGPSEIPDAELVVGERMHDPEPHGTRQRLEHIHCLADDLLGGDCSSHSGNPTRIDHSRKQ